MLLQPSFIRLSLFFLTAANVANAFFKLSCGEPLVSERLDPVAQPGQTPSQHIHTIHGASNFAANSTYDTLRGSQCTSCRIAQDLSNYWFPKLYFQDPKTKLFEAVPNGGLLVYYLFRGDEKKRNGGPGLKAFPPGFKMLSGDATLRSKKHPTQDKSQAELAERAVGWSCLRKDADSYGADGNGKFPTTNCENSFRAELHFPSCWDGKNLDSANHKSHVAFLSGVDTGKCPTTHPIGLPHLFYEVTWNVNAFAGRWKESDGWPFVYATGDPTGYSWHADFQNGWDTNVLQKAIDECDNPDDDTGSGNTEACKALTLIPSSTTKQCKIAPVVQEPRPVDGAPLEKLPGCNPIQKGPEDATLYTDANCPK